jgi:hypothetical protein
MPGSVWFAGTGFETGSSWEVRRDRVAIGLAAHQREAGKTGEKQQNPKDRQKHKAALKACEMRSPQGGSVALGGGFGRRGAENTSCRHGVNSVGKIPTYGLRELETLSSGIVSHAI